MDLSCLQSCSLVQKRAILKVAVELVKADNRIHDREISLLETVQTVLQLPQEEINLIHYMPLSDAVSVIRAMDAAAISAVTDMVNSLMRADSDIDFEENLLYAAVTMSCAPQYRDWSDVISVADLDMDIPDRQIVYLEKDDSRDTHVVLDDRYDNLLISKAFGDIGLSFFYLPDVIGELCRSCGEDRAGTSILLKKSIGYLMPAGRMLSDSSLKEALQALDSNTFFKIVSSRFGLTPDAFPFRAFLMVKVGEGDVLDDEDAQRKTVDFFCLDISADVKHRILSFVSFFGDSKASLPYEGYYRLLLDYFSAEAKINSEICLDGDFNFYLPGIRDRRIAFESSPQARTFYLLLLKFGARGISQPEFTAALNYLRTLDVASYLDGGVFDLQGFLNDLLAGKETWRTLIADTVLIYRALSTKDDRSAHFLSYIISILSHRSSLKTYINKGFDAIHELSDKELYLVRFDKETNAYRVDIDLSMFKIEEHGKEAVPISRSRFWKSLW